MYADDGRGLHQRLLLLLLGRRLTGIQLLLVFVDGIVAHLVGGDDGRQDQLVEPADKRLSVGGVGNDKHRVVQPSHHLGQVVEVVPGAGGQRAVEGTAHKQRGGIRRRVEPVADILQYRIQMEHFFYLLPELSVSLRHLFLAHLTFRAILLVPGQLLHHGRHLLRHVGTLLIGDAVADGLLHRVALLSQVLHPRQLVQPVADDPVLALTHIAELMGQVEQRVVAVAYPGGLAAQPGIDDGVDREAVVVVGLYRLIRWFFGRRSVTCGSRCRPAHFFFGEQIRF